jgi:CubicO group peptidase (beta-lactamase class C family)
MRFGLAGSAAVLLLISTPGVASAASPYDLGAIDSFLQSEMSSLGIPGMAVGIVDGDTIVHLRGFGIAGSDGRRVTPQTPFLLASTSKAFTALAAMQLVEAGKLDLDSSVRAYIPWFATDDRAQSGRITVRQLLNQTSGLSTATGTADNPSDDVAPGALERGVRRLSRHSLVSMPGGEFRYSNSNYQVLGLLVQVVSGQEFGAYLREHIFGPLDMKHTHVSLAEARTDGLASGYYHWFGLASLPTDFPMSTSNAPAAGIESSAEDMAHALIAHLNLGRYLDRTLLSPDGIQILHRGAVVAPGYASNYAMGWYVHPLFAEPDLVAGGSTYTLPLVLDHNGTWSNYHSVMVVEPGLKRAAVVLMNAYDATIEGRFGRIQYGIEQLLAGQPPLAADALGDNTLAKYGRLLLTVALVLQLAWIGAWLGWRRRNRLPGSRRGRILLGSLTAVGLALEVGGLAFLWLVVPGMFDEWWFTLPRMSPDTGLLMVAVTTVAVAWVALRGVVAVRALFRRSMPIRTVLPHQT